MIDKKYIVIVILLVLLFIFYYLYSEISSIKKLIIPTYQKSMSLESRLSEFEKKKLPTNNKNITKIETPPLSITYHSDMVGEGKLSVKYNDLTDSEAKEILKKIKNSNNPKIIENNDKKNTMTNDDTSETINVKINDIVKKENSDISEYQNILSGLPKKSLSCSEDMFDTPDVEVVKTISESLKKENIPSTNSLSDFPERKKIRPIEKSEDF